MSNFKLLITNQRHKFMTDTPIRKTLSLKIKKTADNNTQQKPHANNKHSSEQNRQNNRTTFQKQKRSPQEQDISFSTANARQTNAIDHVQILAKNDPVLSELQKRRDVLLQKIQVLEERLVFISSEPLQAACSELKQQDTEILCQINNILIAK